MRLRLPRFRHHGEQLLYDAAEALLNVRARIGLGIEHVAGPERVALEPTEMAVVCLVRDGVPWLPTFLRHYEALGAKHIFFLDNGSTDGTVEMARRHPKVTVFSSELPFDRYQIAFRRWMLKNLTRGGWGYCCDVDELLAYPFCETLPLERLLAYLNRHGYTGVVGQVLDMFSAEPLASIQGRREEDIEAAYRYYDLSDIQTRRDLNWFEENEVDHQDIASLRGGIRGRVFGTRRAMLTKHALFRMDGEVQPFASGAHFAANARMADLTVAIRHYKFVGAFEEQARRAVREGQYYRGSKAYRRYTEVYDRRPDLRLHSDTARAYRGSAALLEEGFLVASERYRRWAREHSEAA